jgi:hypothetical protein
MRGGISISPVLKELKELLCPSLLENAHKWTFEGFNLSTGHFGYSPIPIDEATSDLLKF